jgi:hypothetical protein
MDILDVRIVPVAIGKPLGSPEIALSKYEIIYVVNSSSQASVVVERDLSSFVFDPLLQTKFQVGHHMF